MFWLGLLLAYLLGGLPLGLALCLLWKGVDPRDHGSGNIGATNIYRILGPAGGIAVFLLDVLKGFAAVILGTALAGEAAGAWFPVWAAVAALVGNNWPVWLKFKGGKGASVSLGIGLGVAPVVALAAFGVWLLLVFATRYISIASIGAVASAPLWALLLSAPESRLPVFVFTLGVAILVIYRHRANIQRLRQGTESKFSFRR